MTEDPTSPEYRRTKRILLAAMHGGEEALFLTKFRQSIPNAEFRLKSSLALTEEALQELYHKWETDLNGYIAEKGGGRKDTWGGFWAFKEEIDVIKSIMLDFGYPDEVRADIQRFSGKDAEEQERAIEETRFRAAIAFWDQHCHRIMIRESRVFYVVPPSQQIFDNNPVVEALEVEEVVSMLLRSQVTLLDNTRTLRKYKTWTIALALALAFIGYLIFKAW